MTRETLTIIAHSPNAVLKQFANRYKPNSIYYFFLVLQKFEETFFQFLFVLHHVIFWYINNNFEIQAIKLRPHETSFWNRIFFKGSASRPHQWICSPKSGLRSGPLTQITTFQNCPNSCARIWPKYTDCFTLHWIKGAKFLPLSFCTYNLKLVLSFSVSVVK